MVLRTDKLGIFVSSTLRECSGERAVAREAIRSLNHLPILFEDLGARPHPPRTMYLRGLNEARIFVGIYRDSYGWTAPGMSISGLEDEVRLAAQLGLPRLLYEHRPADKREARLADLLKDLKESSVTVAHYEAPEELFGLLRDDIAAVVAEGFITTAMVDPVPSPGAKELLARLTRSVGAIVARPEVEAALMARVATDTALAVVGPPGSGKTVLLAQVSAAQGWALVDAEGLSQMRLVAGCVRALALGAGHTGQLLPVEGSLDARLVSAWKSARSITLVVDGADSAEDVLSLVRQGGGTTPERRLVVGSRVPPPDLPRFDVPPWGAVEVADYLRALGQEARLRQVDQLLSSSEGNPLYLRFSMLQPNGTAERSLAQFEMNSFARLEPRARELLAYLALLKGPLDIGALAELLADPPLAPEVTNEVIGSAAGLLKEAEDGVRLVHTHFGETVLADLRTSTARLSFYAERLARVLRSRGDTISAYSVLAEAGHSRAAELLPEAAFLATAQGEVRLALHLLERRLDLARARVDRAGSLSALLSLAILSAQAGRPDASRAWLRQAEEQLESAPDADWALHVQETSAQVELTFGGTAKALDTLAELRRVYESARDTYGRGRIDLHLSTTFIQTGRFEEALASSEQALEALKQSGDDYGVRLAKANRAVALSALPGREAEADPLLAELEAEDAGSGTRMRALICNVLARRHRGSGDPVAARRYAIEAIELGEKLGDRQVAVLNRINLGNTYRDEGDAGVWGAYDKALEAYGEARAQASSLGFRVSEAHALRLRASVHTRQERFALALTEADAAVAIGEDTVDTSGLAAAVRERAKALRGMRRYSEAAGAFLSAALAAYRIEGASPYYFELIRRGLAADSLDEASPTDRLLDGLISVFCLLQSSGQRVEGFRQRVDVVLRGYLAQVAEVPTSEVFATSLALLDTLLGNCPTGLREVIAAEATQELLRSAPPDQTRPHLLALVGFLTSIAAPPFSTEALVRLLESLPTVPGLYFRPQQDGAAHWTLRLDLGRPVICTVTQLDRSPHGFFVALVVAALCWAFQDQLYRRLLLGIPLARSEVSFNVTALREFAEMQQKVQFDGPCSVSRATDPRSDPDLPLIVLYKDDKLKELRAQGHGAATVQMLSGRVLLELVYHLLKGEVDLESLQPKVVSLVRDVY